MTSYAHPDALVETGWLAERLDDPTIRIVDVGFDSGTYSEDHLPGAVAWCWKDDFQHPVRNDLPDRSEIAALLGRSGIGPDTTVVLYGGQNNWYAGFGYWLLTIYGHTRLHLLNGGRKKWLAEGRPTTPDVPDVAPTQYQPEEPDWGYRAMRDYVLDSIGHPGRVLVDVRSREEWNGKLMPPWTVPNPEGQRGGRIPGAVHIPWELQLNDDGTFKSADELRALYEAHGVTPDREAISYCVIGGRSNFAWFALSRLLGYPKVRLYDGSWLEWGTLRGAPIERSDDRP
jgi:thiosulfate/3-mercaptopyruvate sulfurtransferase